jgi:sterol desaturase/sphingolipid hydroxylase (fatty acid hydroxylase superfamily)
MGNYLAILVAAAIATPVVAILLHLERTRPIEADQPRSEVLLDYRIVALNVLAGLCLLPIVGGYATSLVNAAGGGFIQLRSDGWWFAPSLLVLVLAGDLFAYLVHRAQHAVPALWAMHSLHHSARSLRLVTGARHFWIEQPVIVVLNSITIGMILKVPLDIRILAGVIYFLPDACAHLNIRFPLGRFGWLINNPQYHRIHHSVLPEHENRNFCKLLPLFDILFGTVWLPRRDEFPPTGLNYRPATVVDAFIWPLRPHSDTGISQ